MPAGAGLPHPIFSATALSTARFRGWLPSSLRRNSSSSWPGRLRQLVHEAFHEDAVLVDVHAAPEARRDVRIAHRMVDQQVRDGVAERMLAGLEQALERKRIASLVLLHDLRAHARQDRLPRQADVQAGQVVVLVERAGQLGHHHGVIAALHHVLFARPEQLDRRARHLLGDADSLMHVVLERAAPAEAAAEVDHVHFALVGRQALRRPAWPRTRLHRPASGPTPRTCRPCNARWRSSAPSGRGSGRDSSRPPRPSWRRLRSQPSRRRSGCRRRPARPRGRPSGFP